MKNVKKKRSSTAVPVLLGVLAFLILVAAIVGVVLTFVNKNKPAEATPDIFTEMAAAPAVAGYPEDYQAHYAQVWGRNNDFKGYLTLEGTTLATTVVQSVDNTYYTEHGFDGNAGSTAFLDYRSDVKTPGNQLLVYLPGADVQPMFGEIANYKNLEFYRNNPVITFNSVYELAKYKVFSVVLLPSDSDAVPYQSCLDTNDKSQFVNLVQKAMEYSVLNIPVEITDTDKLLTIVAEDKSLVDESGKPAKVLLFARKVRTGESEHVNTAAAAINANKYLPEDWYNQIVKSDYETMVANQIRLEAAAWFTEYELSQIKPEELETLLNARKEGMRKYLNEYEMNLPADEKLYLYEQRKNENLKLNIDDYTAKVDEKVTLKLENKYLQPGAEYIWHSSDDSVLSITPGGTSATIVGKKVGTATVTVTSGSFSASCICRIKSADTLVLNPSSKTITNGTSFNITASDNVSKVSSSNTGVARVNYSGKNVTVSGVGIGDAKITVTGKNGASASCTVKVQQPSFTMDKYSMDLELGNRSNIYITSGEAVNWYTNNISVVRVNVVNNGQAAQIEAVGVGTTQVIATSRYGAQLSCTVTVRDNSIALSSTAFTMEAGSIADLRVTKGAASWWSSSNESVARVYPVGDGSFAQVEAVGNGVATITAQSSNGSAAYCSITVNAAAKALTISPYSMTVNTGELRNISVTSGSAKNWVSNNPSVAQVYVIGDGSMAQVEGISPGYATITVYDALGGWVTCDVTVQSANPPLVIGPANIYMNEGDTETISVVSGYAASWESTNSNVVQVFGGANTGSVTIQAGSAGSAQVIAYDAQGNSQICYVTVERPYVEPTHNETHFGALSVGPTSFNLTEGDWGEIYINSGMVAKWETNNPAVVALYDAHDDTVLRFKAAGVGEAGILIYGMDGSVAECYVSVRAW